MLVARTMLSCGGDGVTGTMKLTTLNDVLLRAGSKDGATIALRQDANNEWHPIPSAEMMEHVRKFAAWLKRQGVVKGDRVGLIAENRWEWAVTDFAVMAVGAVGVPLFPTLTADQTAAQLKDSGAKIVVVSSAELAKKVQGTLAQTAIETIVVMETKELLANVVMFSDALTTPADANFEETLRSVGPDDLATIIYTSGTTGDAKGVMLTHGNFAANLEATTSLFNFSEKDSCVSFLPLSHVTARHVDYLLYLKDVTVAYCGKVEKLLPAFQAVKPTIFIAVPRLYERIRHSVEQKSAASPVKKKILAWALKQGRKNHAPLLAGKTPSALGWKIANKLVYSKVRAAFGGRVTTFVAGGAPLGIDLANWFADAGIPILEGYGLTETSPVISVNLPGRHKIGTTGQTMPNIECRIAEDGELEVRGPSIFKGYWQKPEATAEVMDAEGWFRTGDVGNIDADGFLSITDRKRELIKTTNGKFIAPQPIENKLKVSSLIGFAALQGDKRKYISVLLTPNFASLEAQGITGDHNAVVAKADVLALYQAEIDRVNADLAPFEKIKRFRLLPVEWTIETGEVTPSMKLKRRIVAQKHASEIAEMYGTGE
jgi:long-chain acyl-CoA synthetase